MYKNKLPYMHEYSLSSFIGLMGGQLAGDG